MSKIKLKGILTIVVLLMIAGIVTTKTTFAANDCGGWFQPSCSNSTNMNQWTNSQKKEAVATEENQRKLLQNQPLPQLEKSNERQNLIERLKRFNDPNKVSYIYLISFGKVMSFYTVKGKVSSVNSFLTTPQQVVDANGNQCDHNHVSANNPCFVVDSPDLDGSYGSNGNAIFFFTTEGAYIEWQGEYMLADQPLQMTTQPELVRQVK